MWRQYSHLFVQLFELWKPVPILCFFRKTVEGKVVKTQQNHRKDISNQRSGKVLLLQGIDQPNGRQEHDSMCGCLCRDFGEIESCCELPSRANVSCVGCWPRKIHPFDVWTKDLNIFHKLPPIIIMGPSDIKVVYSIFHSLFYPHVYVL